MYQNAATADIKKKKKKTFRIKVFCRQNENEKKNFFHVHERI